MADDLDREFRLKFGAETAHRFEMYFTGLIFAILGLSIQTARPQGDVRDLLEAIGWLVLLVAGLLALENLRRMPAMHLTLAEVQAQRELLMKDLKKSTLLGQFDRAAETRLAPESFAFNKLILDSMGEQLAKRAWRWGLAQRWLFVLGLCCVGVARAATLLAPFAAGLRAA